MDRFNVFRAAQVLNAMNIVVRYLNNEDVIEDWLMNGVADGDGFEEISEYFVYDDEENQKTFDAMCDSFYRTIKAGGKDGWFIPPVRW